MLLRYAQPQQEIRRTLHAHEVHQGVSRRGVVAAGEGGAHGFRPAVGGAAIVLGPGILAVAAAPAGDRQGHVVQDGTRARAHFDRRCVNRDGLDGGPHGHVHVRGAVERLSLGGRRAAAHNSFQLARTVIQHHRRGLGLDDFVIGAVGVPGAVDLVRRVAQRGIVGIAFQRLLHDALDAGIQRQIHVIAAGAELLLHLSSVLGGVLQAVDGKQSFDHVPDGVFHVMGVRVERRGGRGFFQHRGFGGVQRVHVLIIGNELVFVHAPQHVVRPVVGDLFVIGGVALAGIVIPAGVIIIRVPCHARQHSAFPQGQIAQIVFSEIVVGGHLYAVVILAQVNCVQVGFQNFVFGVPGFQLHGQIGFLNLALVGLLAG